jgi:hypothetical protein
MTSEKPDGGTIMSVIEDIQHRSAHIRWPDGIVPEQADVFAHNDIVIAAPRQRSGSTSSTPPRGRTATTRPRAWTDGGARPRTARNR